MCCHHGGQQRLCEQDRLAEPDECWLDHLDPSVKQKALGPHTNPKPSNLGSVTLPKPWFGFIMPCPPGSLGTAGTDHSRLILQTGRSNVGPLAQVAGPMNRDTRENVPAGRPPGQVMQTLAWSPLQAEPQTLPTLQHCCKCSFPSDLSKHISPSEADPASQGQGPTQHETLINHGHNHWELVERRILRCMHWVVKGHIEKQVVCNNGCDHVFVLKGGNRSQGHRPNFTINTRIELVSTCWAEFGRDAWNVMLTINIGDRNPVNMRPTTAPASMEQPMV
jgi:hypothetical protein